MIHRMIFIVLSSLGAVLMVAAPAAPISPAEPSQSIFVYCAAGMRKPVEELSKEFESRKGVRVELTYDGSNKLLGQIKLTRKGDVYIAGDADYIDMARKESLAGETRTLCWFVPVIMVKKGNPLKIRTLADLTRPGVRLGQGDDRAAAVGRLMPKILALNKVDSVAWAKNVLLVTPTVNELGLAVKLGTLDATVVWTAIANNYTAVADTVMIPFGKNICPEVGATVLRFSGKAALAAEYLEFLASSHARQVLKDNGYIVDKPVQ
ncbi:MAG: substrate-binding domain-containing protein [Fibrobacterota bacterium]